MTATSATGWLPDRFLDRFEITTIDLGPDPDGEDPITATLVRKAVPAPAVSTPDIPTPDVPTQRGAVLYVHGFTDYFFHEPLADFFASQGYAFYALDLRKCGRSLQPQHTPHFTTDLTQYDEELTAALDLIVAETRLPVLVAAHSTGGLITPLWLDRLRADDPQRHAHVSGLLLNSPWLDLQGNPVLRSLPVSLVLRAAAAVKPKAVLPQELADGYGKSIHESGNGEWTYELSLKPLGGFPVTFGFLNAVRRGQIRLHRGIDVGVPVLVLRSDKTFYDRSYRSTPDDSDIVLDSRQMSRWSGYLGDHVACVPVADARHDVFLSTKPSREIAYREVAKWLDNTLPAPTTDEATGSSADAVFPDAGVPHAGAPDAGVTA